MNSVDAPQVAAATLELDAAKDNSVFVCRANSSDGESFLECEILHAGIPRDIACYFSLVITDDFHN